jgi:hypothetical protein
MKSSVLAPSVHAEARAGKDEATTKAAIAVTIHQRAALFSLPKLGAFTIFFLFKTNVFIESR